jgi:hypothetical protein
MGAIHRSMGAQNTLAPSGVLTEADCESAGSILDVQTGMCMDPRYAHPADIAAAAAATNVDVGAAAPPVCQSSFTPSSTPSDWTNPNYALNNTAAGTCSQVNDQNGRLYQQYQTAVQNWVMNGSQGPAPAPPNYVTFDDYWSTMNIGPAPSSVSTAPPGTPIPSSGFTTGDLAPGGAGYPITSGAAAPSPAPIIATPPAQITQKQLSQATNAPPVNVGTVPVAAPTPSAAAPPSGSSAGTSTGGSALPSSLSFLTETSVGSVPNWVWLAGGAVLLFFLMSRK